MDYKSTHPWITFSLTLPLDDFKFWLQLGEIASKIEHIAGTPLRPDIAENLNNIYLAKGVLATTAIEGNTLSEEQVQLQLSGKLDLPQSQRYLQTEIQNILDVCNDEVTKLTTGTPPTGITSDLICEFNKRILNGLDHDESVIPGQIRSHSVIIGSVYRGAPARECRHLLESLCDWLNGPDFDPPSEEFRTTFALIKSIVAHIYLAWIHPFGDGNGRTARLIEFQILLANGIPLPATHLLSDHYNRTRTQYYRELDRASRNGGDIIPFIVYALQGFLDGIREQITTIRSQQMEVAWENYIHGLFRKLKNSKSFHRRRDLVLELSHHGWVNVSDIPNLSILLAKEYSQCGDRMIQRDINAIAKLDIIDRQHGKVRARSEIIQAFLPIRVKQH